MQRRKHKWCLNKVKISVKIWGRALYHRFQIQHPVSRARKAEYLFVTVFLQSLWTQVLCAVLVKSMLASQFEKCSWNTQVLEEVKKNVRDDMSYWQPGGLQGADVAPSTAVLPLRAATTACSGGGGARSGAGKPGKTCPFHCYRPGSDLENDSSFDGTSALQKSLFMKAKT